MATLRASGSCTSADLHKCGRQRVVSKQQTKETQKEEWRKITKDLCTSMGLSSTWYFQRLSRLGEVARCVADTAINHSHLGSYNFFDGIGVDHMLPQSQEQVLYGCVFEQETPGRTPAKKEIDQSIPIVGRSPWLFCVSICSVARASTEAFAFVRSHTEHLGAVLKSTPISAPIRLGELQVYMYHPYHGPYLLFGT